jgi:hypothetical protein
LEFGFSGLEAIKEEELLSFYNQEGHIFDRDCIIYRKGKGWILRTFGIQLGEDFGSLYIHLCLYSGGISSHTHYFSIYDPDLLFYGMEVSYL